MITATAGAAAPRLVSGPQSDTLPSRLARFGLGRDINNLLVPMFIRIPVRTVTPALAYPAADEAALISLGFSYQLGAPEAGRAKQQAAALSLWTPR